MRLPYSKAIEIFTRTGSASLTTPKPELIYKGIPRTSFGGRIFSPHPVIVTDYPKEIKSIYMVVWMKMEKQFSVMDVLFGKLGKL